MCVCVCVCVCVSALNFLDNLKYHMGQDIFFSVGQCNPCHVAQQNDLIHPRNHHYHHIFLSFHFHSLHYLKNPSTSKLSPSAPA